MGEGVVVVYQYGQPRGFQHPEYRGDVEPENKVSKNWCGKWSVVALAVGTVGTVSGRISIFCRRFVFNDDTQLVSVQRIALSF